MPRYFFNVYKDLPEKRAHGRMLLIVASLAFSSLAQADDNQGLRRGGDPHQVSISGLSSGGAMALQYAVAHSGSIIGVGSVAGPAWYCAEGDLAHAMQVCMKGQGTVQPKTDLARQFAAAGKIDSLCGNTTSALKHSFVFQSKDDEVLNPRSGQANVDFLAALTGVAPKVDRGAAMTAAQTPVMASSRPTAPTRAAAKERLLSVGVGPKIIPPKSSAPCTARKCQTRARAKK